MANFAWMDAVHRLYMLQRSGWSLWKRWNGLSDWRWSKQFTTGIPWAPVAWKWAQICENIGSSAIWKIKRTTFWRICKYWQRGYFNAWLKLFNIFLFAESFAGFIHRKWIADVPKSTRKKNVGPYFISTNQKRRFRWIAR